MLFEPMLNQGSKAIAYLADDWTTVTGDGKLSAQWEHTIAVTKDGFQILTLRDEEKFLRDLATLPRRRSPSDTAII